MKPTELTLATGLSNVKELIDSIELEGHVETRLSSYQSENLRLWIKDFPDCINLNSGLIDHILTKSKDETLKKEDFDYAMSFNYQSQGRDAIKEVMSFQEEIGIIGAKEKKLYYIVGVTKSSKKYLPTIYEKTNIEGLLD